MMNNNKSNLLFLLGAGAVAGMHVVNEQFKKYVDQVLTAEEKKEHIENYEAAKAGIVMAGLGLICYKFRKELKKNFNL